MSASILNPYPGLCARPDSALRRVTVRLPREDAELIESVNGGAGMITSATQVILKQICYELRRTNTHTYNPDALFTIIRRFASSCTAPDGPSNNVTGPANAIRANPATQSHPTDTTRKTRTPRSSGRKATK